MVPQPGSFFQVAGVVFMRTVRGAETDFGGRIGLSVHARRIIGINAYEAPVLAEAAEWVRCAKVRSEFDEDEAVGRARRLKAPEC